MWTLKITIALGNTGQGGFIMQTVGMQRSQADCCCGDYSTSQVGKGKVGFFLGYKFSPVGWK